MGKACVFDRFDKQFGALNEPFERLSGDLVMGRVADFHIGLVDDVEPGDKTLLVAWSDIDKVLFQIFGQAAQKADVVRWRAVIRLD